MVLRVNGRVGLVEEAAGLDDVRRMAAAGTFGVVGVDGAALERAQGGFDETGFVEGVGVDRHLYVVLVSHAQAVVDGGRGGAPVFMQFEADGAGLDLLDQRLRQASGSGRLALPLPVRPMFIGKASAAWSMRARCQGPEVQVVALVPVAGPVPPPIMVVTPLISASSICCGQMKWMWVSIPPAVRIMPSPAGADGDVHVGLDIRVAGLADGGNAPVLEADVGLDDAPVVDDQRVGDQRVDHLGSQQLSLLHRRW